MIKNPVEAFIKLLDKKIGEAKDMLIERFNYICSQSPASAKFMWENNVMADYVPEEGYSFSIEARYYSYWSTWFGRDTSNSYWYRPHN